MNPKRKLFALSLAAAAATAGSKAIAQDQALTDVAATAQALTRSYNEPAQACGDYAALWCSGILVRLASQGDALAQQDALYLRADLSSNPFSLASNTLIGLAYALPLPPKQEAAPITPYCALPFPARDTDRTAHGCWPAGSGQTHAHDSDPSSCTSQLGGNVSLQTWKTRFQANQPDCSFSIWTAPDFSVAMQAHNTQLLNQPMQLRVPQLDTTSLRSLPAFAFIYTAGVSAGQKAAIQARQQFSGTHGINVPVLAFEPLGKRFLYNSEDNAPIRDRQHRLQVLNEEFRSHGLRTSHVKASATRDFENSTTHLPQSNFHLSGGTDATLKPGSTPGRHFYGVVLASGQPKPDVLAVVYDGQSQPARDHALYLRAALYEMHNEARDIPVLTLSVDSSGRIPDTAALQYAADVPPLPELSAKQVAAKINARLKDTHTQTCKDGTSAIDCSGLLLRGTDPSLNTPQAPFYPWGFPSTSKARGGISFSYIRTGDETPSVYRKMHNSQGIVITPRDNLAPGQTPFVPLCIFPFDANTVANHDPVHGQCWAAAHAQANATIPGPLPLNADWSSCASLFRQRNKPVPTTLQAWEKAWEKDFAEERDSKVDFQCTLSVLDPIQYAAAKHLGDSAYYRDNIYTVWNEVMVYPWDFSHWADGQLPLDAFYYEDGNDNAKQAAQRYQQLYIKGTGKYVPVVGLDLTSYTTTFTHIAP